MAVQFYNGVLERLLAPEISAFDTAEIPDLNETFDQEDHWLTNLFLNSAIGPAYSEQGHQAAATLIFRTQSALRAYHRARATTLAAVAAFSPGRPAIYQYFQSVADWEVVVLNIQIAFDMVEEFIFPKTALPEEVNRLRLVVNRVKHHAEDVAKAKAPALVLPLWLTSGGVKSSKAMVSYEEIAEMLRELGNAADIYQNPGRPSPAP